MWASIVARVRTEFADILNTPAGRYAELAVIAELLYRTVDGAGIAVASRHTPYPNAPHDQLKCATC